MKLCTTCKIEKPKPEMVSSHGRATSMCKACSRVKASKRYHEKIRVSIDGLTDRVEKTKAEQIVRISAKESGLTHYESTKHCKHGHLGKRLVSTRQCCECLNIRKLAQVPRDRVFEKKRCAYKRKIARQLEKTHYFTGAECSRGHLAKRLVSTSQCTQCLAERPVKKFTFVPSEEAKRRTNSRRRSRKGRIDNKSYYRRKLATNAAHKMKCFMRACLRRFKTAKNQEATKKILGYDAFALRTRIEFNFRPGMTWDNYGEWHIDHVKPLSRFVEQGITDPKIVNALCNLRPLWAADNLRKHNSF